jgi:hypothetical protein
MSESVGGRRKSPTAEGRHRCGDVINFIRPDQTSLTKPGAIINLRLRQSARFGLLAVSVLFSAAFCIAQGAPPTQPSEPAQSPAATSPTQNQDKEKGTPGDPPSAPTATGPSGAVQQNSKEEANKKNDRMFYVMPNYLTVDNESQAKPVSWKEKFSMAAKGSFDPYEFTVVGIVAFIRRS